MKNNTQSIATGKAKRFFATLGRALRECEARGKGWGAVPRPNGSYRLAFYKEFAS